MPALSHLTSTRSRPRANARWPGANLFRNPFGELTRDERAELAIVDVQPILGSISPSSCLSDDRPTATETDFCLRHACQLIGQCGRGKSTHLLVLKKRLAESAYVYLPEDQPCPSIPAGRPLLIDEAQRLPRRVFRQILRSGLPLVLATHRDLSATLRRHGYRFGTCRIGLTLSIDRLMEILNRRILASRRDPDAPVPLIVRGDAEILTQRFGTDIRSIENYLYEVVQSQVSDHGEMRFID